MRIFTLISWSTNACFSLGSLRLPVYVSRRLNYVEDRLAAPYGPLHEWGKKLGSTRSECDILACESVHTPGLLVMFHLSGQKESVD